MATPLHVRCKSKSRVRLVRSRLRKHPFLLALRRRGRFARKVPSGEEREETDVFAGYVRSYRIMLLHALSFAISIFPIKFAGVGGGARNTKTKCTMGYVEMADTACAI